MSGNPKKEDQSKKLIASNPTAHQNYFLEELVEAGVVLQGTEIKSIRSQSPNLKDSYVEVTTRKKSGPKTPAAPKKFETTVADVFGEAGKRNGHKNPSKGKTQSRKKAESKNKSQASVGVTLEAWLVNMHIGPYSHGNIYNHEPKRRRKLLLHSRQIQQMFGSLTKDGKTIIPTRMYFSNGRVKIEIAIAKGKKKGDKRDDVKRRDQNREMEQAMKKRRTSER